MTEPHYSELVAEMQQLRADWDRLRESLRSLEGERDRYRAALEEIAGNRWSEWGGKDRSQLARDALDG